MSALATLLLAAAPAFGGELALELRGLGPQDGDDAHVAQDDDDAGYESLVPS